MKLRALKGGLVAFAMAAGLVAANTAQAKPFNDLFLFGDSYTDTGASFPLTNGGTAGSYLAQYLGIPLVTPPTANPGTRGVNFAESGARIAQGPTPPAVHPLSLTQQVAEFQAYVQAGALTFNPDTSLFFLLGGLNDHASPTTPLAAATMQQVATLYGLGARYFEIALIPSLVPAFADSAANINPLMRALVPQLQQMYPDAWIQLSNWGTYYDDILRNPGAYGITNATDPCLVGFGPTATVCANPDQYFYYYIVHPSDRAHEIVGERLLAEVLAIPEPLSIALLGTGLVGMALVRRRRRS